MAKKTSYLDNLKKEIQQKVKASGKLSEASYKSRYGVKGIKSDSYRQAATSAAKSNEKAFGQLAGAIFMGARYDDKTGKRISGKK